MTRVWDVFPAHRSRIYAEDGLVTVKVEAPGLNRQEVLQLVLHLLEAAGAPTLEAVMAIGGITFDEPGSASDAPGYHRIRALAVTQQRQRTERARALLAETRADPEMVAPDEAVIILYRQGVVPSEIAEVMGLRLSGVIGILEDSGVMDD